MRYADVTIAASDKIARPLALVLLAALLAAGIAMFALPGRVEAHGESVNVTPTEAKPGASVTVAGEEFPPGEEIALTLEGVKGTVPLGHVEADADGSFSLTIALPSDATPGSYQLVAATEDDNIVLNFTVLKSSTESPAAGETVLTFQRSTSETIAIGLITAALILGGTVLVVASTRGSA